MSMKCGCLKSGELLCCNISYFPLCFVEQCYKKGRKNNQFSEVSAKSLHFLLVIKMRLVIANESLVNFVQKQEVPKKLEIGLEVAGISLIPEHTRH